MIQTLGMDGKIHVERPFKGRSTPHETLCGKSARRQLNTRFGVVGDICETCVEKAAACPDLETVGG